MREIMILAFLLVVVPVSAVAQAVLGAREVATGQAVTALPDSKWAVFGNPAMVSMDSASVAFYGIRYYGLTELTDAAVALQLPTSAGAFSAGAHRYGFELFSETRVRVGYTGRFGGFRYGMALNYTHVKQGKGYGSAGAAGIDLGVAARLFHRLWVGGKSTNVNHPEYAEGEPLPREFSLGLSFRIYDTAVITSDLVKDVRFPLSYRTGIELILLRRVYMRSGITSNPSTFSMGFGYAARYWAVNLAAQYHEALGISPGLDFGIHW